jgi:hypothetical protein
MNAFTRAMIATVSMMGIAAPAVAHAQGAEMKPPPELAEAAKAVGTWKCTGQGMDKSMKMAEMTGTLTAKLELDGWWLHQSFAATMGKTREPYKFESYVSFDQPSKKWKRVLIESGGSWASGESAGMKDGKLDWDLSMHMMGDSAFRDHEDASDPKAGVKMWGEFSPDKGKTWVKVYEMSCKK